MDYGLWTKNSRGFTLIETFVAITVLLTALAGFDDARTYLQWKETGRHVKAGEHAFYILEPCRYSAGAGTRADVSSSTKSNT